jgi:peptidoglycan/xylan/chitin deacetylase (PgdA/CDA1 family)
VILDKLRLPGNNGFILMFHHITDEKVEASPACISSINNFLQVLEYLKRNNIKVVSIDEALINIKKKMLSGFAVITFDDGMEDTFEVAYPILKKYNFPFTVYITLSFLNKEGYLLSKQLNILNKEPLCTLGAHSMNHPVLMTSENAKEEIVQSKRLLENIINKEVVHFAYPYGSPAAVSVKNILDVKRAGYKSSVSTVESKLNYFSTISRFYLPRVNGSFFFNKKNSTYK